MSRRIMLLPLLVMGCTPETPAPGRALYVENCAVCHGMDAGGNGQMAASLTKKPPDLTRIADRRDGVWPMLEVMSIIDGYSSGIQPREGMPVFGKFLDEQLVDFDTGNGVVVAAPRNLIALVEYLEAIQSPAATSYVP
ncbi:c-type cytochrome [Roseivivax sp. CAU 1753]